MKRAIIYIITIVISIIFIFIGNKYTSKGFKIFNDKSVSSKAVVIDVLDESEYQKEEYLYEGTSIKFICRILNGQDKNKEVEVIQYIDSYDMVKYKKIEVNDKIILTNYGDGEFQEWIFSEYDRSGALLMLFISFMLLLVLFGGRKGVNTIISLILTAMFIFMVFIPAVLSGLNIYFWTVLTSIVITIMTLIIVYGIDKKAFATLIGCTGGLVISGIIIFIMDKSLKITGMVDEDAFYLSMINPNANIDLKAVVFAGIIIGALGAVMDVAMSIAASLWEVNSKITSKSKYELVKSGLNIGRDIMGTMSNTLVLAYIGSSLSVALLLIANNYSFIELINREMVIVEILQALIGSIGILFTIPITSIVCSLLFYEEEYIEATQEDIEAFMPKIKKDE